MDGDDDIEVEEAVDNGPSRPRKPYIARGRKPHPRPAAPKARKAPKAPIAPKEPKKRNVPIKKVTVLHLNEMGQTVEDGDVSEKVMTRYKEFVEPKLLQLTVMANEGKTNDELAEYLGMSRQCFDVYRKQFPALQKTIEVSRNNSIDQVVNSMFKASIGYHYTETKVTRGKNDKDGNPVEVIEEWTKYKAPDTAAGIFLLTNRRPEDWKRNVDPNVFSNTMSLTVGSANISEAVVKNIVNRFGADMFSTGDPQDAVLVERDEPEDMPPPALEEPPRSDEDTGDW